jgi:regulator of cell morphogenesis and NO signaling
MQTLKLDQDSTVGEWVADRPHRSRVFEELGIDYCCGGKTSLAEACREKGLDRETVIESLLRENSGEDQRNWANASLTELADHIEATHHAYLRSEMPQLSGLTAKVAQVHGPRHAELAEVVTVFAGLAAELDAHMVKEEQILFPMIRQLERADGRPASHCGSIANPIRVMEYEHDQAGNALAHLHQLTNGYSCPPDACNSWRAMCDGLRRFEADLHEHIHKENNILFPRAMQLESGLD